MENRREYNIKLSRGARNRSIIGRQNISWRMLFYLLFIQLQGRSQYHYPIGMVFKRVLSCSIKGSEPVEVGERVNSSKPDLLRIQMRGEEVNELRLRTLYIIQITAMEMSYHSFKFTECPVLREYKLKERGGRSNVYNLEQMRRGISIISVRIRFYKQKNNILRSDYHLEGQELEVIIMFRTSRICSLSGDEHSMVSQMLIDYDLNQSPEQPRLGICG